MENKVKKRYVSIREIADMLGISRIAVYKKIKKGQIHAERIGRAFAVSQEEFEKYTSGSADSPVTTERKKEIGEAVGKVVKEYGETLKLLGKE